MNKELRIKPLFIIRNSLFRGSAGFTLMELVLTLGIMSILAGIGVFSYANSYRINLLNNSAEELTFLTRLGQQESISQKGSNAWGVRFDNTDSGSPFAAVFSGTYAPANVKEYYSFPAQILLSNPQAGSSKTVTFAKLTGLPDATASIVFALRGSSILKTLIINEAGGVLLE